MDTSLLDTGRIVAHSHNDAPYHGNSTYDTNLTVSACSFTVRRNGAVWRQDGARHAFRVRTYIDAVAGQYTYEEVNLTAQSQLRLRPRAPCSALRTRRRSRAAR